MVIQLSKFGHLLSSRELGREAWQAFRPTFMRRDGKDPVVLDFQGVTTFSPSWGDEFISSLLSQTKDRLILRHTGNASVQATLKILEEIHGQRFSIES